MVYCLSPLPPGSGSRLMTRRFSAGKRSSAAPRCCARLLRRATDPRQFGGAISRAQHRDAVPSLARGKSSQGSTARKKEEYMKQSGNNARLGRRALLRRGALASVGIGLVPLTGRAQPLPQASAEVRRYVPLGKTGIKMSDISFGASRLGAGEEHIVRHAFDRGVNYFDTAESYTGGESENTIGNALQGKRDKVFITSKVSAGATDRRADLMTTLEGSLRRLRTDYVD